LQPTTGVSTLNGLNVLNFAADYLTAANTNEWVILNDGTDWLLSIVFKPGTSANPNALYGAIGNNGGGGVDKGMSFFYDDRSGSSQSDAIVANITRASNDYVAEVRSQNKLSPNVFNIAAVLADPTAATADRLELAVDDGATFKGNTQTLSVSTSNPTNALQIGALGVNQFPFTGSIAEVVIVSGADATDANRIIIRNYLNEKWAVY
jgi:hypothetical protein